MADYSKIEWTTYTWNPTTGWTQVCYAMEVESRYVDMAIARWEQYTGGKAEVQE